MATSASTTVRQLSTMHKPGTFPMTAYGQSMPVNPLPGETPEQQLESEEEQQEPEPEDVNQHSEYESKSDSDDDDEGDQEEVEDTESDGADDEVRERQEYHRLVQLPAQTRSGRSIHPVVRLNLWCDQLDYLHFESVY